MVTLPFIISDSLDDQSVGASVVTIKDVARVSGLSTSTVSRVIRGDSKVKKSSRAKVQKIIKELGYRPNINAQALVSKRSHSLGVVIPQVSMPFFSSLVSGAEGAAKETHHPVLIVNAYGSEQAELDAIESLQQSRCDAIVFHSIHTREEKLVELAERIPGLIFINRLIAPFAHRCVWLDTNQGAQEATRYLLENGHTNIAIVTLQTPTQGAQAYVDGIKVALNHAGVTHQDLMIGRGSVDDMEGGKEAVINLLTMGAKFTAILAYNDTMALGVIHELIKRGVRVPEDVSVAGFDDSLIASVSIPQLTTMHCPIEEMANYAAKLAIELAAEPMSSGRTHLFMPHLVKRDSVKQIN